MDKIASYRYDPMRGVYDVHVIGEPEPRFPPDQPSTLRALFDNSFALHECGCAIGMSDARRAPHDTRAFDIHRRLLNSVRHGVISRSFSRGYVHGFAAVTSGAIA